MSSPGNGLYSSLMRSLTSSRGNKLGRDLGSYFNGEAQSGKSVARGSSSTKPPKSAGVKASSMSASMDAKAIQFGNPSQRSTPTTKAAQSSTSIAKVASNFLSGGLANVAGGSLGSLGIGSIVTDILSLFKGNSSTPPPLVRFELPSTQNQAVAIGSDSTKPFYTSSERQSQNLAVADSPSNSNQSAPAASLENVSSSAPAAKQTPSTPSARVASSLANQTSTGRSLGAQTTSAPNSGSSYPSQIDEQWFMERSNEIAKAVRNAMLNSSSLNDVIAEV